MASFTPSRETIEACPYPECNKTTKKQMPPKNKKSIKLCEEMVRTLLYHNRSTQNIKYF